MAESIHVSNIRGVNELNDLKHFSEQIVVHQLNELPLELRDTMSEGYMAMYKTYLRYGVVGFRSKLLHYMPTFHEFAEWYMEQ